jgi:hypothetical protein
MPEKTHVRFHADAPRDSNRCSNFASAVQIVDLYHARPHLWELARKLYPNDPLHQKAWMKRHQKQVLDKGKIEKLVVSLHSIESPHTEVQESSAPRPTTLNETPSVCATRSSATSICSSARA